MNTQKMGQAMQTCVEDCNKCYQICLKTLIYCIQKGGKHIEVKHLNLLEDCIEICRTSENFMLRQSEHSLCLCSECAEICENCAQSCEEIDKEDPQMQECAEACRKCAETCKTMTS